MHGEQRRIGGDRRVRSRSGLLLLSLAVLSVAWYTALAQTIQSSGPEADKMADASRSAPAELVAGATILDWPEAPGGPFRVLREGTNGWSCLPDYPGDSNYAPECFNEAWKAFLTAYLEERPPATDNIGLSYMLNARWSVSNTDRYATEPTKDNQWHEGGSHIMLSVPDPALLERFPTEPTPRGGAYVMFAGTPYAHLMIPIPEAHAPKD